MKRQPEVIAYIFWYSQIFSNPNIENISNLSKVFETTKKV
jgi:hypothetical protein